MGQPRYNPNLRTFTYQGNAIWNSKNFRLNSGNSRNIANVFFSRTNKKKSEVL